MGQPREFQELVETLPVGLLVIHRDGHVLFSNAAAAEMLGSKLTAGSKSPIFLPPGQHQVPGLDLEAGPLHVGVHPIQWQGQPGFVALLDTSQSLGWTSQDTEQLAYEDPLTGLPNLNILTQFIEFTCTQAQRYQRSSSLILVDIDDFRGLKQQLGESASDQILVEVAMRLQQTVRSSDLVGRRGQDQFIVLLTELTNDRSKERSQDEELTIQERASRVTERILREFETPFLLRDIPVTCRLSMGLTVCPQEATTPDEMLLQADIALRQAKRLGGERFVVYDSSLGLSQNQHHDLKELILQSLRGHSLKLDFEPYREVASGQTLAWQAQPRLDTPPHTPSDIWAFAEQEGFVTELSEWLMSEMQASPRKPFVLPLSSTQLLHRELPLSLAQSLAQHQLKPADCLILVSETALLRDLVRRVAMLRALREQGFAIVLDLGAGGLVSLQLLSQLRPDWLRISSKNSLFTIVCSMAAALNIDVVTHQVDVDQVAALSVRAYNGPPTA